MTFELLTVAPARDRRVRRSRSALTSAAVALVAERGTAAVAISDIAERADVSRQLVYQQFGDRDTLLLEAALDLARRELLPHLVDASHVDARRAMVLAMVQHFADHRAFHRALLTSPCAFELNKALTGLFIPVNRQIIHQIHDDRLDASTADDVAAFLTAGFGAFVSTWVIEGDDPLDPETFTDRLLRTIYVLTADVRPPAESSVQSDRMEP